MNKQTPLLVVWVWFSSFMCILNGMNPPSSGGFKGHLTAGSSFQAILHLDHTPQVALHVKPVIERMHEYTQTSHTTPSHNKNASCHQVVDHFLTSCRTLQASGNTKDLMEKRQTLVNLKNKAWFSENKQAYQKKIDAVDAMLNAPITQKLKVIREGSLDAAERTYESIKAQWPYCMQNQIITLTTESQQIQDYIDRVGFDEAHAAACILSSRPDYRQKQELLMQEQKLAQQASQQARVNSSTVNTSSDSSSSSSSLAQQQNGSQEVKTQSSVSSQAESPKSLCTSSSISSESQAAYDLKLTTPTDSDLLFRQRVTADPAINLGEYLVQVRELVNYMKENGLYAAQQSALFIKEVAQGTAKHLAHVAQHPVEYTQQFVETNLELAKEAALFFVDAYSAPEELNVNEHELRLYQEAVMRRGEAIAQKYNELCEIVPQMNRTEWANLTSSIIVDGLILHGASKSFNFAKKVNLSHAIKENPLLFKVHETLERTLAKQPEVITAEGITLKVIAEPVSSASTPKSAAVHTRSNQSVSSGGGSLIYDTRSAAKHLKPEQRIEIEQALMKLVSEEKAIQKINDEVVKVCHIFADEHIEKGIMRLGRTESEILAKFIDKVNHANQKNLLCEGTTRILTLIDGHEVELRVFISGNTLFSINAFMGYSNRTTLPTVRL